MHTYSYIFCTQHFVGTDETLVGADETLVGTDEPFVGADEPLVGADESLVGADETLVGTDEPLVGADETLYGADEPLVGVDEPFYYADEMLRGENNILNNLRLLLYKHQDNFFINLNFIIMGKVQDYLPRGKNDLNVWSQKFFKKVSGSVNHYGINKEVIKSLEDDTGAFSNDLINEEALIDQKRSQVKQTQADMTKLMNNCRNTAQMIKNSPDYTDAVGRNFDIIGPENPFDPDTYHPELKLKRVSNGVEISFNKSLVEGVNIYRQVQGEEKWTYMAHDTHSPYLDTKEMDNHATYEYMAWGVISDVQIGKQSSVVSITV